MGNSREPRKSEITFKKIMEKMLNLNNCVWCGKSLLEDVREEVMIIKRELDEMIEEMEEEKNMKFRVQMGYLDKSGDSWWETYDSSKFRKDTVPDNIFDLTEWVKRIIQKLNDRLQPHEKFRRCIKVEIIEEG